MVERIVKIKNINVVRIGNPAKVIKSVVPYTLDVLLSSDGPDVGRTYLFELEELKRQLRQSDDGFEKRTIHRKLSILHRAMLKMTNTSAAEIMMNSNVTFSTLIGWVHHSMNGLIK